MERKFIDTAFTFPFYQQMLNKRPTLKESTDPNSTTLSSGSKKTTQKRCGLELYFIQDMEIWGKVTTHELKEDGKSTRVTEESQEEYMMLLTGVSPGMWKS